MRADPSSAELLCALVCGISQRVALFPGPFRLVDLDTGLSDRAQELKES
jgi:hypothetical protein